MLAIILDHYHLRNDIRLIADELKGRNDVVFYAQPKESGLIENDLTVQVMRQPKRSLWNSALRQLYFYFGNLPTTKKNYYNYFYRRLHSQNHSYFQALFQTLKLRLQLLLPCFFSFDKYINLIDINDESLSGVTAVLSFTDINNENMVANVLRKGIPLYTYVHSWDHLAKFRRFSKNQIKYITWSDYLTDDLATTHGVSRERAQPLAASQYTFIYDYKQSERPLEKENFFYYVASFGYPKLVEQEMKVVRLLAKIIEKEFPNYKLLFRPYPVLKDWEPYNKLKSIKNIDFDTLKKRDGILLTDSDMNHKLDMIKKSRAVIHCGTTIGIEASYFDTPVLYVCPEDIDYGLPKKDLNHIFHSWDQFHLRRYYRNTDFKNVALQSNEIAAALHSAINDPEKLLGYNRHLSNISPLISMEKLADNLLEIIRPADC